MNLLKKITLVILAAVWLPATSHCLLVALSGLESLTCCAAESAKATAPQEEECDADACATVEAGFYKIETVHVAPQSLPKLMLFESCALDRRSLSSESAPEFISVPLELRPSLHFRTRASLPARAPTLPC